METTNVREVLRKAATEAGFSDVHIVQDLYYAYKSKAPTLRRYKLEALGMGRAGARKIVDAVKQTLNSEDFAVVVYDLGEELEEMRWAVVVRQELKAANKAVETATGQS